MRSAPVLVLLVACSSSPVVTSQGGNGGAPAGQGGGGGEAGYGGSIGGTGGQDGASGGQGGAGGCMPDQWACANTCGSVWDGCANVECDPCTTVCPPALGPNKDSFWLACGALPEAIEMCGPGFPVVASLCGDPAQELVGCVFFTIGAFGPDESAPVWCCCSPAP
jgi:hypothetical protein